MAIEIKFTAENFWGLREQMLAFISIGVPPVERIERSPKRGRPPKAPSVLEEPVGEVFMEEEPVEAASVEPVEEEEEEQVNQPADSIANEKLKQEVIDSLQALFMSGKVKVVRHVLDKYGNGAKSFPEIEANVFPAIKEALDRGEAA